MKKDKKILKLVEACIGVCCKEGRINARKVRRVLKQLKALPSGQAIFAIAEFLRRVKKQKDQYQLIIESPIRLSASEINKITKLLKREHFFSEVRAKINPNLLGGLKLKIGDDIWDYSLAGKINQLGGAIHG